MNGQLTANNLTYSQGNLRLDLLRNQGNQTLQDQIQETKPLTIDPTKLIPVQLTTVFVPGTGFVNAYLEKRQPEVALNKFVKQEPLIPTDAPNLRNAPVFDPIKEYYTPLSITKHDCRVSTVHFSRPLPFCFDHDLYSRTLAILNGEKTNFCNEEENEEDETIEETKRIDEKT